MSDTKYIEIRRYWNNELSSEALIAFKQKMAADANFAEEVALYNEVSESIASRVINEDKTNDLKNTLTAIIAKNSKVIPLQQPAKKKRFPYYWIAASFVILLGISMVFNNNSKPSYQDFANHETLSLTVRGTDNINYKQAEKAFNTKQYKRANNFFDIILNEAPTATEIKLYKAISLIEINNFNEADSLLRNLSKQNTVYSSEACWYLALSKLKQKDYDECKKALSNIVLGDRFFIKSQKLLQVL